MGRPEGSPALPQRCAGGGRLASALLPAICLVDPRVSELLEKSCRLCPPLGDERVGRDGKLRDGALDEGLWSEPESGDCLDATQDNNDLSNLALDMFGARHLVTDCPLAFWAANIITMQYSLSTRVLDVANGLVKLAKQTAEAGGFSWTAGFDLSPFPFWSSSRSLHEQLTFHSNFMSAHIAVCDDRHKTGPSRGKHALRAAHDKPEFHCAVRATDFQMMRRCRARRRRLWHDGMQGLAQQDAKTVALPPPRRREIHELACPSLEEQLAFAERYGGSVEGSAKVSLAIDKYGSRATGSTGRPGSGCEEPASEWMMDLRIYHKCILVVILERLQLAPGAAVLDWGTGCGHKLTWASTLYDIHGLGVDIVADNIAWAQNHSIGKYCQLDGRYVEWLPDDFFDAVLSYAALTHLEPRDQCAVIVELVGKMRLGGRLWFGWNAPNIAEPEVVHGKPEAKPEEFWSTCFQEAAASLPRWASGEIVALWATELEADLFPDDITYHSTYLFWPPAYSLFVTRTDAQGLPSAIV